MKLSTCTNNEMVIEAKNEEDYKKAYKVAKLICENAGAVISAVDEDLFIVCIGTEWLEKRAADLRYEYKIAKAAA